MNASVSSRAVFSKWVLSLLLGLAGLAGAQEPASGGLAFKDQVLRLTKTTALPTGQFSGERNRLVVDGGTNRFCRLSLDEGGLLEDVAIVVAAGAELQVRKGLLRRCRIELQARARVVLEDTGLESCELAVAKGDPAGVPELKMSRCVLVRSAWLDPVNALGLDMQDCRVLQQRQPGLAPGLRVETAEEVAKALYGARIRNTRFEDCQVPAALLFTVNHCSFLGCTVTPPPAPLPALPAALPQISLHWQGPGDPRAVLGGALQLQDQPVADGPALQARIDASGRLEIDGLMAPAPVIPLLTMLGGAAGGVTMPAVTEPVVVETAVKRRQTEVNGLLVMPLADGREAGEVSRMNLTALPGLPGLRFTQQVGTSMTTALHEVDKFMQIRHGRRLDMQMEIAFEEKYSGKDGPSAAVACGLLLEAAFTGRTWDTAFAVTGDMNADGRVMPIGGVAAKVRGATKGACRIVAVPARNETAIADILLLDGPGPLAGISIFGISTFEEAVHLAAVERPPELAQALAELETVQAVLKRDARQTIPILRTPQAAARLQAVLAKAPHCLSAKYLLMFAQGRPPASVSLAGSLEATDQNAQALVAALRRDFKSVVGSLRQDELGGSLNRLRNLRPRFDQRVWGYLDCLVDYGEIVRGVILNPVRSSARAQEFRQRADAAAERVLAAKQALLAVPEVREELGL